MSKHQTPTPRLIAMILSWCISFGGTVMAVVAGAPQIVVMGLFFGGLLPYVMCIQLIEPWLESRRNRS